MRAITIAVAEDYIPTLRRRLEQYGITAAELAREMGVSESVLSRWFNSKRRFGQQWTPRMSNIVKVEMALVNLRRRKARLRARQARAAKSA